MFFFQINSNNCTDLLGRFVVNTPLPPQLEDHLSQSAPADSLSSPTSDKQIDKETQDDVCTLDQNTSTQNNGIQQRNSNNMWLKKSNKSKHLPTAAYLKDLRMHRYANCV